MTGCMGGLKDAELRVVKKVVSVVICIVLESLEIV